MHSTFKKRLGLIPLRVAFAITYTFVVLPFTVDLFDDLVSPSSDIMLFNIEHLSLTKIHKFFLPVYLCALEFASIKLAISFWEHQHKLTRHILILTLFFLCQSYAMFSTFYDIRGVSLTEIVSKNSAQMWHEGKVKQVKLKEEVNEDYFKGKTQIINLKIQNFEKELNEHKAHIAQLKEERADSINDRNKILQEMNQVVHLSQKISDTNGISELRRLKKRIDQLDRNIKDNDKNIRNWNSKRRSSNNANTDKIIEELNTQIKRYEKEKDEKKQNVQ